VSRYRTIAALAGILVFVALSGCASAGPSPDEALVRATIQRYDTLLAQGYRSMNMNGIREVATQLQAESEYIHMASLGEGGVRLLPDLRSLEFVKVSVEGTAALVETLETWDYTHVNPTTGAVIQEQKGLVYRLAWDLNKEADGRWLVSDVRAIESTTAPAAASTPTAGP
jgi:hypothetical protein